MTIETKIETIIKTCGNNRSKSIRKLQALMDEKTAELAKELQALLDEITPQNIDTKIVCQAMMNEMLSNSINQRPHTSTIACLYALVNQHYGE